MSMDQDYPWAEVVGWLAFIGYTNPRRSVRGPWPSCGYGWHRVRVTREGRRVTAWVRVQPGRTRRLTESRPDYPDPLTQPRA